LKQEAGPSREDVPPLAPLQWGKSRLKYVKKRDQREMPFPGPSNAIFFSRKTAFSGGGCSSCPLLQKDRKVPEKNWNLHPHFTLGVKAKVQLKSSNSIGAKN
jgi:hypothetical protein